MRSFGCLLRDLSLSCWYYYCRREISYFRHEINDVNVTGIQTARRTNSLLTLWRYNIIIVTCCWRNFYHRHKMWVSAANISLLWLYTILSNAHYRFISPPRGGATPLSISTKLGSLVHAETETGNLYLYHRIFPSSYIICSLLIPINMGPHTCHSRLTIDIYLLIRVHCDRPKLSTCLNGLIAMPYDDNTVHTYVCLIGLRCRLHRLIAANGVHFPHVVPRSTRPTDERNPIRTPRRRVLYLYRLTDRCAAISVKVKVDRRVQASVSALERRAAPMETM